MTLTANVLRVQTTNAADASTQVFTVRAGIKPYLVQFETTFTVKLQYINNPPQFIPDPNPSIELELNTKATYTLTSINDPDGDAVTMTTYKFG